MTLAKQRTEEPLRIVERLLQGYAEKGVFRGFSLAGVTKGRATFRIVWHRDQRFDCILDPQRGTIRFPMVLPNVSANSKMDRAFKQFVTERHNASRPEHRRIDAKKCEAKAYNRGGHATITVTVKNGDYGYATRKLVNLIHEVYLDFVMDGLYYDYLIDTFDLDPDNPT